MTPPPLQTAPQRLRYWCGCCHNGTLLAFAREGSLGSSISRKAGYASMVQWSFHVPLHLYTCPKDFPRREAR